MTPITGRSPRPLPTPRTDGDRSDTGGGATGVRPARQRRRHSASRCNRHVLMTVSTAAPRRRHRAYDTATQRATFTPTARAGREHHLHGTVSGAKDLAGNTMTGHVVVVHHRRPPPPAPAPVRSGPSSATPANPAEADTAAGRGRHQVPLGRRRDGDRRAVLQGHRQHRNPRRAPVDDGRGEPRRP